MSSPGYIGRSAEMSDVPVLGRCLASAFFEDPVWGQWAFPDRERRGEQLRRLLEFWVRAAVRHPWVHMLAGGEAVAVWIPPGVTELTAEEEKTFAVMIAELAGPRAAEFDELFEEFEVNHPRAEPHYYLSLWGTHRDHAGRGLGSAVIAEDLARIDAEHMPAYLESTNPANIPRYEALGFRPVGEFGPSAGPTITTMWRTAR
jgi:ribosomal protein S18 acetylase RimI-like enzyme